MWSAWQPLLYAVVAAVSSLNHPEAQGAQLYHHDYVEMLAVMKETNEKCPDITRLYNLTGKTVRGRELAVIEFSDFRGEPELGKPAVKYIGNIHGNEVVGRELMLMLMSYLCSQHASRDGGIVNLLRSTSVHIMPSMNPDGWQSAADSIRELGYSNGITGRTNANGIDLNRNFPDLDAPLFARATLLTDHLLREVVYNRTGLQPETRAVIEWILSRPFVLSASFHGGDLVVNYPYDEGRGGRNEYSMSPDDTTFRLLSRAFSLKHHTMAQPNHPCRRSIDFGRQQGITNGAAWYSVTGGMQDFNYLATNCFEVTVELGCTKFPTAGALDKAWSDNRDALINFLWQAHIGFKGQVVDATTREPLQDVVVHVKNLTNDRDVNHDVTTDGRGYYWRLITDGDYLVSYSKPGYKASSRCLSVARVPYSEAQVVHVQLHRNSSDVAASVMEDCAPKAAGRQDASVGGKDDVTDLLQQLLKFLKN